MIVCEYAALNAALHNIEKKKKKSSNGISVQSLLSMEVLIHTVTYIHSNLPKIRNGIGGIWTQDLWIF